MTELLIVKSGEDYFRFIADGYEICGLNKASVYPLSQYEDAKKGCRLLLEAGIEGQVMKLTISEELFSESNRKMGEGA